jgi:N6-adenosine-specific RNA methylase IME4
MKHYSVICADPPWSFGDRLGKRGADANYSVMSVDDICGMARGKYEDVDATGPGGWQVTRSKLVETTAIAMCGKRFAIADDCLLFLWRVASMPREALDVVRAWGFVAKSEIVWIKAASELDAVVSTKSHYGDRVKTHTLHFGMGRYTRGAHETCIIAARGKATSLIQSHSVRSVFIASVPRDKRGKIIHSAKPPEFYDLVEELTGSHESKRKLELFARGPRPGWVCAGDEIGVVR